MTSQRFATLLVLTAAAASIPSTDAASIRGFASNNNKHQSHKVQRVLRHAPAINFRELQDADNTDVNCTNFNQHFDEHLESLVREYGPEEWIGYICNKVTNEMVMRPIIDNPSAYLNDTGAFGDYGTCATEHFEHALMLTEEEGLPFLPDGGFAADGNSCAEFIHSILASNHNHGDGRKLELITLIVAVVLVVGIGGVAIGGISGIGFLIADAAGAFDVNEDDEFFIVNEESGLVLDVDGGDCDDGTNVILYDKHGGDNQKWRFGPDNSIVSVRCNNKALDVNRANCADGTNIQLYEANGSGAQQWSITEEGYIAPNLGCNDRVMDVANGQVFTNGANIQIHTSNGTPAQRFRFET